MQTTVAIPEPTAHVAPRLSWRDLLAVAATADMVVTLVVAAVLSDLEAAAVGVGVAAVITPTAEAAAADARVVSEGVAFDTSALQVEAGEVTVELTNRDLFWHTFTIDELGVDLAVPVNGDRQVTFDAPPGTYRFYCRIPGHETRMAGALTVR